VDVPHPDEKSIITYVSSLYDAMPRVPNVQDGIKANVLWRQFLKFKETELPAKEADKNRSKHIFKSFEGAVQAGQVKVPPGYHPFDVEKEWGRLHVAILERERLLRTEFERLERLQRIVSKVQMESGVCEEQLNQVETLLQMDVRMMSSGKPAQHIAEVEADLEKAEGMIRFLFNDVQLLKDGRHLQAEQMYRRVYRLHERLVNIRSEYNLRLKSGVTTAQIPVTQMPMTQIPMTQVHTAQVLQQSSSRVHPELDEVTLRYVHDLLGWVEENQRRVDEGEWGSDLPNVETQLGSHRGLHQSVEEFRSKIERAKADEKASKARLRYLVELHAFVSAATKELMWLNEKEEEEVNYDWSERNSNMASKKECYSGLMRELELREKKVNGVQATGDKLLRDGHPARQTIEITVHRGDECALLDNSQPFKWRVLNDQGSESSVPSICFLVSPTNKDAVNSVAGLDGNLQRLQTMWQMMFVDLKSMLSWQYLMRDIHIINSWNITMVTRHHIRHRQRTLLEAFTPEPPPLVPTQSGKRCSFTNVRGFAVKSHLEVEQLSERTQFASLTGSPPSSLISFMSFLQFKTLRVEEYRLALRNLEQHYQDFLRDSQDSQMFGAEDRMQVESNYNRANHHYQTMVSSAEQGWYCLDRADHLPSQPGSF
ncbi:hypothetical protein GOODEAATRI_017340, partial [Goodea atripinnis]